LRIINPYYKIQDGTNIFELRKIDYDKILPLVREIVKPVEEIGFTISELDLKDARFISGDLSRTIKQTLTIKLQKGPALIDLTLQIPKLIDDNYIFVNGRKKIPLFQLYDVPLITRGDTIKFRTNVATLMLTKDREQPNIKFSFLSKKFPFSILLLANYGMDECINKFDLGSRIEVANDLDLYNILRQDLKFVVDESKGYTQDDFILEIGNNYSKFNARQKGEDVLYGLDLIAKVDPITRKFMVKDTAIEELIEACKTPFVDDTLLSNKRLRIFEYIITSKLSKIIFEMCVSNRTARQPKFSISSTQILADCNVSDIVQFDFAINPIEELTKLSRTSILGPGGFSRENIPSYLRDIFPTMFGRICPVDTPDRDNCGVLQSLVPNVPLDENLKFTNEASSSPISIPVAMVPFLKNDDQTRLQMTSSQMRQAIMLKDFTTPLVSSGCEGLYTDHTQFVKRAKKDGEVLYLDYTYLIVQYSDGETQIFNVGHRRIYVEHLDLMNVYVKKGDKFKAGDILAESNFCKDGNINIGQNLLTGVMIYYGHNYEDGIVVSERLIKESIMNSVHYKDLSFTIPPDKVLLSLKSDEYKPLPDTLKKIKAGDPYAILKKLTNEDPLSAFSEEIKLEAKREFIISDVNLYANTWNKEVPVYDKWIEKKLEQQQEKEKFLKTIIKDVLPAAEANKFVRENDLEKFSLVGKYKSKKEKINGILVEIIGVHFRPLKVGDKIANRHGNKGIISRIVPHDKMPQLPDGRHLDICINPLGIISRMNIGQLYELHLGMSVMDLKMKLNQMIDKKESQAKIRKYLLNYIKIIDSTKDNWYFKQFLAQLPDEVTKDFVDDMTIIQAPFESCNLDNIKAALKYTGTEFRTKLFDPISKEEIFNPVSVGYLYFFRMVHIAEEKLAARGIGAYTRRTLQPLGGRKNKGGQRCGEMETACIIGHDAPYNLFEFFTTKSDCIDLKNEHIRKLINPTHAECDLEIDTVPESVKLLRSYLTVIGVDIDKKPGGTCAS